MTDYVTSAQTNYSMTGNCTYYGVVRDTAGTVVSSCDHRHRSEQLAQRCAEKDADNLRDIDAHNKRVAREQAAAEDARKFPAVFLSATMTRHEARRLVDSIVAGLAEGEGPLSVRVNVDAGSPRPADGLFTRDMRFFVEGGPHFGATAVLTGRTGFPA